MKILSTAQIKEADAHTIAQEPVTSIDLMERAATACLRCIIDHYVPGTTFEIYCGPGNNGGDGLALCRLLLDAGFGAHAWVIDTGKAASADHTTHSRKLAQAYPAAITILNDARQLMPPAPHAVVVDALLGTGLNRPPEGILRASIHHINNYQNEIIAIDMPSGLYADAYALDHVKDIVKATRTFCFQSPRLAFMLAENDMYIGEWHVLDIGLSPEFMNTVETKHQLVVHQDIQPLLRGRGKFSHKGHYGHTLLVAGGYGKTGAAIMAARGCLRAGTGLLTVHVPRCCNDALQVAVPEAMTQPDSNDHCVTDTMSLEKYSALGIGPGLGTATETQQALKIIIQQWNKPMVLDADALNILSENLTWLAFLPARCILTPHPGEFRRLAGAWNNDFEKLELAKSFAVKHQVYVVLKGAHTATLTPQGDTFFNSTGNPGMAKGGSGDVLTGIITALLAQGYDSLQACVLGTYVHGLAGDLAAADKGLTSMLATDLIDRLPEAFKHLEKSGA